MKIGIEIHQRLNTTKLFCECPSLLVENKDPDLILNRRLHPVVSELGEIDEASKQEFKKKRVFEYQVFEDSNCLVESDEEPPHPIDPEALAIAIELSLHLNAKLVNEVHIMRKIVIDGSNTSGFQRTAVISMDGFVETSKGKVRISSIALEEESAGIIGKRDSISTYRLDRLGIPLVEITTEPDIQDGDHLKEVAERIGSTLRSTGKVMRGIGTIRQDVNVSTEKGARTEIKGAQDLKLLPLFVQNEVKRQEKLIEISEKIKHRFGKKFHLKFNPVDLTEIFSSTNSKLISSLISKGQKVFGIKLINYSGLLGIEFQKGKGYGSELSDYAKSAGVKGIIQSDEDLSKYKISEKEIGKIKDKLAIKSDDAFALVVAPEDIAKNALKNVFERALILNVPKETRKANPDATTSYMRPLPGKARMYPETDIPPVELTDSLVSRIKRSMSKPMDEQRRDLEKILNKDMAQRMFKSKNLPLFRELISKGFDPMLVASTLENTLIQLRREGIEFLEPEKVMLDLFSEYKKEKFVKSAILDLLLAIAKGHSIDSALDKFDLHKLKGRELEKIAKELNYNIKEIMKKYRLRVDPKDLLKLKNK